MSNCEVVECRNDVNKAGHTLCYEHWLAKRDGELSKCPSCGRLKEGSKPLCYPCFKAKSPSSGGGSRSIAAAEPLSATDLGEIFNVSAQKINLVVAELGWVKREHKGWSLTPQGEKEGGSQRESRQSGIPYVVWRPDVVNHRALIAAIVGEAAPTPAPAPASANPDEQLVASTEEANFRDRYSIGAYRSQDGHRVRSRAELVIDDWLYHRRIIHAYERELPTEERAVCDFWLPEARVYIEYWGMEQDAQYAERKRAKKAIYDKYGFKLLELGDLELKSLEDHLPRMLRKFGVDVD